MSGRWEHLCLVGDELFFNGELVAVLVNNLPATIIGRFTDMIDYGPEDEDDADCGCPPRLHKLECSHYKAEDGKSDEYDDALQDVERAAKEYARGGLLRMPDLATLIATLREEVME